MIMMPYNCSSHRCSSQATQTSGTPHVASARDSGARRIADLPNPLSRQGAGLYNLLGRGLRYQCSFVAS